MNENRTLIHQIYDLKKAESPPINGEETMQVAITQQLVDKSKHSPAISELVGQLKAGKGSSSDGVRLMMLGSENDDSDFMDMVQTLDATFVIDEHCTGTRYFWNEVIPEEDPLAALANRYLDRPACPAKDWPKLTRFPHILKLAKDWNVQGAILVQQKFCDPHEFDIPPLKKYLEENGIRTYFLEFDVTVPIGQFKIRMEAFLEMLRADELPF